MLIRSQEADGVFARVTPEAAGWDYLHMEARRLQRGAAFAGSTGMHEQVIVILGGRARVQAGGQVFALGRRVDVFHGMPEAVYLPRRTDFEVTAESDVLELATCWVPTDQDHPLQVIRDSAVEIRGGGNVTRQINSIIPPGFDCHRLVCVEVYTPSGNWSSYPPHKHDQHRVDEHGNLLEADLEEIYFYKIDPPEHGFAYQRVYTADGRLDELHMARNHDVVLVPEGYHPVVSAPGYTTYYLNFLAGSAQSLANTDDPAHSWVKGAWGPPDSRLPMVQP